MSRPTVLAPIGRLAYLVSHTTCFRRPRDGGLAAVGDSITVGTGAPRYGFLTDDSWVSYIVSRGRVAYGNNAAVRGQTTEELLARLPAVLNRRPTVVVVTTGTNDSSPSRTIDLISEVVEQVRRVHAEPVLATIPPLVPKAADVNELNGCLRTLVRKRAVRLIDFNAVLADGDEFKAGLTDDGKHPNMRASQLMAQAAEPVLVDAFTNPQYRRSGNQT